MIHVGKSDTNSKTVNIYPNLVCPETISKNNWIIGSDWEDIWRQAPDTFSVDQNEEKLTITRTDSNDKWDLNLAFHCCFKGIQKSFSS